MKLKISLNEERGDHSDRIASGWQVADVEIKTEEDAREVFCNYSYSPHEWVGGYRKEANYNLTNFLVIDFDDGVTIDQAKDRFKPYQCIIITSRNHRKLKSGHESEGLRDRFQVVLPINKTIINKNRYTRLKQAKLFADSDPAVFDLARMFFASPQDADIYINEDGDPIDINTLEYNDDGKINLAKIEPPKLRFYNYPETVQDAYGNKNPILLFEGRADYHYKGLLLLLGASLAQLRWDGGATGPDAHAMQFAVVLGGRQYLGEDNYVTWNVSYGTGAGENIMAFAGSHANAVLTRDGKLETMPAFSVLAGFMHRWSQQLSSNFSYAYGWLDVPDSRSPLALKRGGIGHVNLIWDPVKQFSSGIEYMWGAQRTTNDALGLGRRIQAMFKLTF